MGQFYVAVYTGAGVGAAPRYFTLGVALSGRCKASEFLRQIDAWRSTKRHTKCARNVTGLAPSSKNVIVAAPIRVVCIAGEWRY